MNTLLTPKDVQKMLKCSLPLIYKMAQRGQLPCVRWGCPGEGEEKPRTMVRFRQNDVMEFIEKHYRKNDT
jgi:predicted DNA-binding transcriptional regulator AlpA